MRKLIFLIILSLLASCKSSVSPSFPASANVPEDLMITLERTGCYATRNACPTYKLTVNADGSVVFEGRDVTKVKGKVEDKISVEKVKQLIGEFEKANYFNLEDSYDGETCPRTSTDRPNANTSIQIGGKKKSVSHNLGCRGQDSKIYPPELYELENKIDEIVETKRWIGERK